MVIVDIFALYMPGTILKSLHLSSPLIFPATCDSYYDYLHVTDVETEVK